MFIELGHLSFMMIFPILIPILYFLRHLILDNFNDNEKPNKEGKGKVVSAFMNTFIISLSNSLALILCLIEIKLSKTIRIPFEQKQYTNQLLIEKNRIKKKIKTKIWLYAIILAFFDFFNFQIYDLLKVSEPDGYDSSYFYSLSISIFFVLTALMSHFFLNLEIHRHHILTMIISLLLSISLFLTLFISNEISNKPRVFLHLALCIFIRSFRFVLLVFSKMIIDKYYISISNIMFIFGITGIILSVLLNIIIHFSSIDLRDFIKNIKGNKIYLNDNGKPYDIFEIFKIIFEKDDKSWSILSFLGSLILWFGESYLLWFTVYFFSPSNYLSYASFTMIAIIILNYLRNMKVNYGVLTYIIISLVFIFLCVLVFNEIVIIHLFKLSKYTSVEINKRQIEETKNSEKNDGEIMPDISLIQLPETSFDNSGRNNRSSRSSSISSRSSIDSKESNRNSSKS